MVLCVSSRQAHDYHGEELRRAVEVVVQMLIEAGQLPAGYGDGASNQLPRPPSLLGRDDMLANVLDTLRAERILFVVGSPGEGKSVLAAEAAHHMSARLLCGGCFAVDLAAPAPVGELRHTPRGQHVIHTS
jgi:hypothetical protein